MLYNTLATNLKESYAPRNGISPNPPIASPYIAYESYIPDSKHYGPCAQNPTATRQYASIWESLMEVEYGCSSPIRWGGLNVTLHDSKGNTIEIPECTKCQKPMSPVMGKEVMAWYCYEHGYSDKVKEAQ